MKKIILSAVAVTTLVSANSLTEALQNGTYSTKARVFYFDRSFDKPGVDDAQALTAGGIMKYVTGDFNGLKAGIAYYGSHRLGSIFSREEGKGTSILGRNGEDLSFLGEAYLEYNIANSMIKVGRQQLSTPLIQNHDLRILPSVYEAAIVRNKDIQDTTVELGFVKRYTGFTSKDNRFNDYNSRWGQDGLGYVSVKNKTIPNVSIRAQYVMALDDKDNAGNQIAIDDYKYIDAKYAVPFGQKTYLKVQYGGNAYNIGDDSTMYGMKVGTTVGMFDFALLYDKIDDNQFKAVESGPMYSDWQQGYGNYEPSEAFGGQIIAHPIAGLSFKVGYVDVAADSGYVRDDFTEMNIDAKYKINNISKLRVRYSQKDQSSSSDREDRDDFRIIYYLNF